MQIPLNVQRSSFQKDDLLCLHLNHRTYRDGSAGPSSAAARHSYKAESREGPATRTFIQTAAKDCFPPIPWICSDDNECRLPGCNLRSECDRFVRAKWSLTEKLMQVGIGPGPGTPFDQCGELCRSLNVMRPKQRMLGNGRNRVFQMKLKSGGIVSSRDETHPLTT